MASKSILVKDMDHCMICGAPYPHCHHVLYGTSNRKNSERFGLVVPLCYHHHNGSGDGVHFNKILDTELKKYAQERFQEEFPEEDFIKVFGRSWL